MADFNPQNARGPRRASPKGVTHRGLGRISSVGFGPRCNAACICDVGGGGKSTKNPVMEMLQKRRM